MDDPIKTERVVLRVTTEKKDEIAEKAQRLELSVTDLVLRAVDNYNPPAPEGLFEEDER